MAVEESTGPSNGRAAAVVLNVLLYLCIFVGSPAVGVAQDMLTWPYRYFGIGFVTRVLWTTIIVAGVPLVVALIARKGRGIDKRVFLVVWLTLNVYVICESIRTGRQY